MRSELPATPPGDAGTGGQHDAHPRLRRFKEHRLAVVSAITLLTMVALTLIGPLLLTVFGFPPPDQVDPVNALSSPSLQHPLGTDELGRDVLMRLLVGGRVTLGVGTLVMFATMVIGVSVGVIAGYFGGVADSLTMRVTDTMLAVPTIYILLVMSSVLGRVSVVGISLIIALTAWMGTARLMRAEFLSLREREFVIAARVIGGRDRDVILGHILPSALPTALVAGSLIIGAAILAESSLSFLGLGIQPPDASWGTMLQNAQVYIFQAPHLAAYPGICIVITVLCISFVGDGLREALDPRLTRR